jgi:hypothetical protein
VNILRFNVIETEAQIVASTWLDKCIYNEFGTEDHKEKCECFENPFPTIDYRCEDGRFPVKVFCYTISNFDLLSRNETELNSGIRSTFLNELNVKKTLVIYFTKKKKSCDSTTWLWIWHFRTPARKRYLQCHVMAERFLFLFYFLFYFFRILFRVIIGVLWKRDKSRPI